jgi:hypothetical protein
MRAGRLRARTHVFTAPEIGSVTTLAIPSVENRTTAALAIVKLAWSGTRR